MTSPTDRLLGPDGVPITKFPDITVPVYAEDGRRVHRFRQSSLKTLDTCTERARFEMSGLMPNIENDAANLGTAWHAGAEMVLNAMIEDGTPYPLSVAIEAAQDELTTLMESPDWRWVKYDELTARWFITEALILWYNEVVPTLKPVATEIGFGPLVLHEDNERIIEVTGTIDYLDEGGLKDWKTSGRKWDAWEHERWDIQPTVYSWAANELGICVPGPSGLVPFEFVVLVRHRHNQVILQRVTVQRHRGDWNWLKTKAIDVARLIEANLTTWPKNDNHALCSPKWCPAWDQCKGKNYSEWPRPTLPSATLDPHQDEA